MGRRQYQRPSVLKTKGKNPQYYFRVRLNAIGGDRPEERYYLGECREITKRQAEKARDEIIDQEKINQPTVRLLAQVKFVEVLTGYRKTFMPGLRPVTAKSYESILTKHIEPRFGALRICDVDFVAVQNWVNEMTVCIESKKIILAVFNAIWKAARKMNYTKDAAPTEGVRFAGHLSDWKQKALTWEEWRRLRAALPAEYHLLADLVMFTGIRISEALGLTWDRVDMTGKRLLIDQRMDQTRQMGETKTPCSRRVLPMGPMAKLLAERQRGASGQLFAEINYFAAQEAIKKAAVAIGVDHKGFGWHTLRRTYNTYLRNTANASVAMAQLGHRSLSTNDVYLVTTSDSLREQESAMQQAYLEAMGMEDGKIQ